MNILFDSKSTQVLFQLDPPPTFPPTPPGMRLNTLLGAIKSIGLMSTKPWNVAYTTAPIDATQLQGVDVYVSLTRYQGAGYAYQESELAAIKDWVDKGGNVLLMTNHGDFRPPVNSDNYMANDAPLAAQFGITLQDYSVQSHSTTQTFTMQVSNAMPEIANNVNAIAAHNSCIILPPPAFTPLVNFPVDWTAYHSETNQSNLPPPSPYFAIMVTGDPTVQTSGKVIVIGNSGWVGDLGSPHPAPGMVTVNSNLQFVLNCIGYLGGYQMPRI